MFLYLSPQKAFLFLSFIFSLFQAFRDLQIMGTAGAKRCNDLLKTNLTGVPSSSFSLGAFHLDKISGISGPAVNGTRFVSSSHWKIPRKSGKSKKVDPFSRLEFPNGMSCSIYVSRSLYQFQVHGRALPRTGVYDQMEQLFTNRKFHFCSHPNFQFFSQMKSAPCLLIVSRCSLTSRLTLLSQRPEQANF